MAQGECGTALDRPEQCSKKLRPIRFSREMGLTHAEFFRSLPAALAGRLYSLHHGKALITEDERPCPVPPHARWPRAGDAGQGVAPSWACGSGWAVLDHLCLLSWPIMDVWPGLLSGLGLPRLWLVPGVG